LSVEIKMQSYRKPDKEGGVNDELCSTALAFLSLIQGLALIFPWEVPKHFQIKQIHICILVLNTYILQEDPKDGNKWEEYTIQEPWHGPL